MVFAYVRRKIQYERDHEKEYLVKAAMLIKFCQHTKWPESMVSAHSRIVNICIVGSNPFPAQARNLFATASTAGKEYRLLRGEAYKKQFCHIVFVGDCSPPKIDKVLQGLKTVPTLTVSDIPDFANMGGDIEFVVVEKNDQDQKIKLILNEHAALEKGLLFDSEMKNPRLSKVVRKSH